MSKTNIRNARCTIPSPNHPHHLPRKYLPLLEWESAVSLWSNSCFPWSLQMAWFSIRTTRATMAEITSSSKVYRNSSIPCYFSKSSRITTHTLNIFHAQLYDDSHITRPHPSKTALHMPPHGKCMKLLSEHAIFHLISKSLHTAVWNSTMHSHPKNFSTVPLLTFLDLAFTMVNLLLLCNLNSTSSMPFSLLSIGCQTDMQVFYITPALRFGSLLSPLIF